MEHYFTNNKNLRSEMRTISFETKEIVFTFFSDLGVFSKDKIDYGSRSLLNTILKNEVRSNLDILDVGCGYGFLGICLSKILNSSAVMSDVNKRALHLCDQNIKKNKVNATTVESNGYENITGLYDMIVTNPPIRAGKDVVLDIILSAGKHLKSDGKLWVVIRKDQGVKSVLKRMDEGYIYEVMAKDKGFYCVMAKRR